MRAPLRSAALLVVAALALAACSGVGTRGSTGGYVSADGQITTVDPGDRKPAPVLSGPDLDGTQVSTKDYAGKVMVVNVWGSWCPPCRKEAPVLKAVADERKDAQFLGLLVRDKPAPAKAFNRSQGITYPSIVDSGGKLTMRFGDSLPSRAIPTTWIIDSKGRVAARILTDELTESTLSGLIDYAEKSRP
ncbi:MAG: TlpA disulfide reductase family protein [Aeromicrobium erythreum]